MTILSIDTSCDETSAAVLDRDRVLSSVTWSQIKYHRRWGGVVPSIARRAHTERLPWIVNKAVHDSRLTVNDINAIAVTVGPGLAPALEAGIHYAKALALLHKIPLIPVNHLEGHLASIFLRNHSGNYYIQRSPVGATPRRVDVDHGSGERMTGASLFLRRKSGVPFSNLLTFQPSSHSNRSSHFLSLIVSGGHTELCLSPSTPSVPSHRLLGQTLDDAAGECLDKVGRELGLGYPAGPVIEGLAREAHKGRTLYPRSDLIKFPIPLQRSPRADLNFSFSGLKTAAIQIIHGTHNIEKASRRAATQGLTFASQRLDLKGTARANDISRQQLYNFCASFQEAVINALLFKLKRAIQITGIKTVILTGGVAANNRLRRRAGALVRSLGGNFYAAPKQFTGDNAAMIGLAAQWALARGEAAKTETEITAIDRQPNLNFLTAHEKYLSSYESK